MSDLDDFKATYFDECSELLLDLEEQFAAIGAGDRSPDRLNAVFRAVHSIKGGAGAFGFSGLVAFAHAFETLLDHVRGGRIEMRPDVVALCVRANDIVADFVAAARLGKVLDAATGNVEKARFDQLSQGAGPTGNEPMDEFDIDFTPVRVTLFGDEDDAPFEAALDLFEAPPFEMPVPDAATQWSISFVPHPALYARANDPLLLLRELTGLGRTTIRALLKPLPQLADFEPFGVYCSWEITLQSEAVTEAQIREIFEFVEGDCDLTISGDGAASGVAPAVSPPPIDADLTDRLMALSEEDFAPYRSIEEHAETPSFAELAAALKPLVPPKPDPAAAVETSPPPPEEAERRPHGVQSIRVDLDKVDRVVNMIGELVITQSMLTQQLDETLRVRYQDLVRGLEVLAQTTRGLQDSVMAIRAQPVKSVFSRMPRLVRELAQQTGKSIRLETVGENTEIDKTVIEQLSDPLTHMIRNSADHGIESPEMRLAAGKSETGTIRLSASQAGGSILIVVEDDGAGIDRERVLAVARQRGVVAPDAAPSDEAIDQLIFAPGFSTVDVVSDISGRGVGMDVVLSNIKKIGGSVHVRSVAGRGTRMTLKLPLTLAVLDVMLVKVGGHPYVVPLSSIVETLQCTRASFSRVPSGGQVLQVRGEYVQVIDLAVRFGLATTHEDTSRFVVLCEAEGSSRVALVVDDIVGQQQVVIKSLEENFESIEGIAGGTILGDGNVALIVDVLGLKASPQHARAA